MGWTIWINCGLWSQTRIVKWMWDPRQSGDSKRFLNLQQTKINSSQMNTESEVSLAACAQITSCNFTWALSWSHTVHTLHCCQHRSVPPLGSDAAGCHQFWPFYCMPFCFCFFSYRKIIVYSYQLSVFLVLADSACILFLVTGKQWLQLWCPLVYDYGVSHTAWETDCLLSNSTKYPFPCSRHCTWCFHYILNPCRNLEMYRMMVEKTTLLLSSAGLAQGGGQWDVRI